MQFKINDFTVITTRKNEDLDERIAVAQTIEKDRPTDYIWKYKTRSFIVFESLLLKEKEDNKNYRVIEDLFNFIDFIEVMKCFSQNKLDTSKTYYFNNKFVARTVQRDHKISLEICFKGYSYSIFLDKFECSTLAAKFSKILQKCEAWQEWLE